MEQRPVSGAQAQQAVSTKVGIDTTLLLTGYVVVRLVIPSQLSFPGLGSLGSPAALLGVGLLVAWMAMRVYRHLGWRRSPVLLAALGYCLAAGVSLVAALTRPILSEELHSAVVGALSVAGWFGVLALAHDGLDFERLSVLLNRIVLVVAALAVLGVAQFASGQVLIDQLHIPGLVENGRIFPAFQRGRFTRPSATAIHPIEFGAVLSMVFPLAVIRGFGWMGTYHSSSVGGWVRRWSPAVLIGLTIMLSSSRSAWVGMVLGVVMLFPVLSARQRVGVAVASVASVGALFVFVPGMLTLGASLTTNLNEDSSVQSRVQGYSIAQDYVTRAPWTGRGLFTFLPRYHIFDNQFLLALVETGVIGALALVILILVTIMCGFTTTVALAGRPVRSLALALTAGCVVGAFELATFDGFSFPMMAGIWFLFIGLTGACYRLAGGVPSSEMND